MSTKDFLFGLLIRPELVILIMFNILIGTTLIHAWFDYSGVVSLTLSSSFMFAVLFGILRFISYKPYKGHQ